MGYRAEFWLGAYWDEDVARESRRWFRDEDQHALEEAEQERRETDRYALVDVRVPGLPAVGR